MSGSSNDVCSMHGALEIMVWAERSRFAEYPQLNPPENALSTSSRVSPGCLPSQTPPVLAILAAFSVELPDMPDAGTRQKCHSNNRSLGRRFPQADKIFFEENELGDRGVEIYRIVKPIQALETCDLRSLW